MKSRLAHLALCCSVLLSAGTCAHAQAPGGGHPPGGPPPGTRPQGPPPGAPPPGGNAPGSNAQGSNNSGAGASPRAQSVTSGSGVKLGPPGRWWDDKTVVQNVGLSRMQQKKMDAIFNANRDAIVQAYQAFQKQQAALNTLSKSPQVDKAQMFAAIDAVNQARATLAKANTEMLLQIRQQLDPAQITKLESLP